MAEDVVETRDSARATEAQDDPKSKNDDSLFNRMTDDGLLPELNLQKVREASAVVDRFDGASTIQSKQAELQKRIGGIFAELTKGVAIHSTGTVLMAIANELADNPKVLKALKDLEPSVTTKGVDHMRSVAAGEEQALKDAKPYQLPPKSFDEKDVKTLENVRKNMEKIADSGAIPSGMGLAAGAIKDFSTEKIADKLSGQAPQEVDVEKIKEAMKLKGGTDDSAILDKLVKGAKDDESPPKSAEQKWKENPFPDSAKPGTGYDETPKPELEVTKKSEREVVAALGVDKFPEVAKRLFDKIDKDGSGKLTRDEIYKAMEDPSIKGQEAQALVAMYSHFSKIANLAGQQGFFEWSGITKADLEKIAEVKAIHQGRIDDASKMELWAKRNLQNYDISGNGKLSYREIEAAINNPKTSDSDKRMLQLIKENYSQIGPDGHTGLSMKAFENYYLKVFGMNEGRLVGGINSSLWSTFQSQEQATSRDLYGDSKDPLKSIVPDAIRQGSIGNCYFHAALGAVAQSNPQLIKDMIKDNGDGTYTVTFPGAKNEPITVKAPTEAEQSLYNKGSKHGIWANVLEKAYGQYSQTFYRRSPLNPTGGNTPAEGSDGGGRPEGVMKLLTGSSTDTDILLINSQASIAKKLEDAFSSVPPKAVAAGINNLFFWDQTSDGFYAAHAYSITGFVPDGKGGGMVTIRNPWGGAEGSTYGTITVPLEKFIKNFSQIIFEYR